MQSRRETGTVPMSTEIALLESGEGICNKSASLRMIRTYIPVKQGRLASLTRFLTSFTYKQRVRGEERESRRTSIGE